MSSLPALFDRLIDSAAMSFVLLALGSVGVFCCREPIRRMRIIVLTFAGCLLAPVVGLVPGVPHWSVPGWEFEARSGHSDERARQSPEHVASIESSNQHKPVDRPVSTTAIEQLLPSSVSDDHSLSLEPAPTAIEIADTDLLREIVESPAAPHTATATNNAEPVRNAEPTTGLAQTSPPAASSQSTIHNPLSTVAYALQRSSIINPRSSLLAAYAIGLASLILWWLAGLAGLLRVLAVARPAPESYRRLLREIGGPAADRVRLLVSPRAAQPFTFAWRRPVIVMPDEERGTWIMDSRSCQTPQTASDNPRSTIYDPISTNSSLRSALAHEWSHVARGDAWIWSFAGLVRLVYYYQPLCWWLRRQLRLCQDFLADSDAARQSSPTEYAEFLATRALGRPLALGLGITAGKSDLYRRVSMLVRNQRPLEAECPVWWNVSVGAVAIAIISLAATFGNRGETRAASVDSSSEVTGTTSFVNGSRSENVPSHLSDTTSASDSVEKRVATVSADEVAAVDPAAGERNAIVAAMLARPKLPAYMRVRSSGTMFESGQQKPSDRFQVEQVFGNGSWRIRTAEFLPANRSNDPNQMQIEVCHNGRYWTIVERQKPDGTYSRSVSSLKPTQARAEKRDNLPAELATGFPAGVLKFIESNREKARLGVTGTVNDLDVRFIEWDVNEKADIGQVFFLTDDESFRQGGVLRLAVVPSLKYAITRMEHVDREGNVQATVDSTHFVERVPGLLAPREIRVRFKAVEITATIDSAEELGEADAVQLITADLPAGPNASNELPRAEPKAAEVTAGGNARNASGTTGSAIVSTSGRSGAVADTAKPADAEKQKIIDGVLARAAALKSGVFEYVETRNTGSRKIALTQGFVLSGPNWVHRSTLEGQRGLTFVNYGGHSLLLNGSGRNGANRLRVDWPRERGPNAWPSSLLAGLAMDLSHIPAAEVRLVGTEIIDEIETHVLELPASETDKRSAPPSHADADAVKAIVRVNVAPKLGYVIVRKKRFDQFGLTTSLSEYSDFRDIAAGFPFPFRARVQRQGTVSEIVVQKVSDVNGPIADRHFVLPLPAGTEIEDVRPHWNDWWSTDGEKPEIFGRKDYPLREFTLLTDETNGLPPSVLAEMDRDLVPMEFFKQRLAAVKSGLPAGGKASFELTKDAIVKRRDVVDASRSRSSRKVEQNQQPADVKPRATDQAEKDSQRASPSKTEPATSIVEKSKLRYSGKSFDEWRLTLLHDLDPETRVKAFEALGAFATAGYADEIVSAVREALKTDQPELNKLKVQRAAFTLLGRLGAPALPVLEEQMASGQEATKRAAIEQIVLLAEKSEVVVPVLLRVAKDKIDDVRVEALKALMKSHPNAPGVADAVNDALATEDNWLIQSGILGMLLPVRGKGIDIPAESLFRLLRSKEGHVRPQVAILLVARGPGTEELVERVRKALLESNLSIRAEFVSHIEYRQAHGMPFDAAATVPVLIALLERSRIVPRGAIPSDEPSTEDDHNAAVRIIPILARMPMDGPARTAIPVLIRAAEGTLADKSTALRLAAIEGLGSAGAAAKDALPALKRLREMPAPFADEQEKSVSNWRTAIKTAIQRIEGE